MMIAKHSLDPRRWIPKVTDGFSALETITFAASWVVGISLSVIPAIALLDYGGVLPWTRWAVAIAVTLMSLFLCPLMLWGQRWSKDSLAWPSLIAVAAIFLVIQQIPLPAGLVSWLSPGSADAYARLADQDVAMHTISVSPWQTRLALAIPAILGISVLAATVAFRRDRTTLVFLTLVIAMGTMLAVLGVGEKLRTGGAGLWPATANIDAVPFGPYVNRNNAACQLNLTLASAIGMIIFLAKRDSSRRGYNSAVFTRRDRTRTTIFNDAAFLLSRTDGTTLFFATLSVMIAMAIFVAGSRGAMLGTCLGVTSVIYGLSDRGKRVKPTAFAAIGVLLIAVLAGTIGLLNSASDRLASISSVSGDARWGNWRDGISAAFHYLPLGSGGGTYQFAYLPYQETSSEAWFVNADCLPLEWFVEGGLVGLAVPISLIGVLIHQSLWLRRTSGESLDRAVAATGIYVAISQGISQSFDFGLLQFPAVITLGALSGMVFARCSVIRQGMSQQQSNISLKTDDSADIKPIAGFAVAFDRLQTVGPMMLLAIFAASLTWSTKGLFHDSKADYVARTLNSLSPTKPPELQTLLDMRSIGVSSLMKAPNNTRMLDALAAADVLLFRKGLQEQLANATRLSDNEAWAASSVWGLRSKYFSLPLDARKDMINEIANGATLEQVSQSGEYSSRSLLQQPLDDRPRFHLSKTDFLRRSEDETGHHLEEIARLRKKSPSVLVRAARTAIPNPGPDAAALLYRDAFALDPTLAVKEWGRIRALPQQQIINIASFAGVATLLNFAERCTDAPALKQALIEKANLSLSSALSEDDDSRAGVPNDDFSLNYDRARIESLSNRSDAAIQHYRAALEQSPRDIDARIGLIRELAKSGAHEAARQELAVAKSLYPSEPQVSILSKQLQLDERAGN